MKEEKDILNEAAESASQETQTQSQARDGISITEDAVAASMDGTADYSGKELDSELEKLAEMFKTEMKKVQAMSEDELIADGVIIQPTQEDEKGIPEEELCQCCGENRCQEKDGVLGEYCEECIEAMRRYPLSATNLVVVLAVAFVAISSLLAFITNYTVFSTVREAKEYASQGRYSSAIDAYDGAIAACEDAGLGSRALKLKKIELIFNTVPNGMDSMYQVAREIDKTLSEFELSLPLYRNYRDMRKEALVIYGTMQKFYEIINQEKYEDLNKNSEKYYDEIMNEIGAILDETVAVYSPDGKTTEMVPTSEAMVRFCQYMYAYVAGEYEECYTYMKRIEEINPEYLWLYAYELGTAELQQGNSEKARELAEKLYESNPEIPDSFALYSYSYRLEGNCDKAIKWADKGLEYQESAELLRMKAMAYVVQGDLDKAKEAIDEALACEEYGLVYYVAIVVENELGNTKTAKEYKKIMKDEGIGFTDRMEDYFDGKLSAVELFTEGTGDVE